MAATSANEEPESTIENIFPGSAIAEADTMNAFSHARQNCSLSKIS